MPLTINGQTVHKINGPSSMVCLKPKLVGGPYIILFGDIHTEERFEYCYNEPDCVELIQEFVPMLNDYAATTPTDIYVEGFMQESGQTLNAYSRNIYQRTQVILDELHDIRELKHLSPTTGKTEMAKRKMAVLNKHKRDLALIKKPQSSNLVDFNQIYELCFYHATYKNEMCKYKNIKWQFADARKSKNKGAFNFLSFTNDLDGFKEFYELFSLVNKKIKKADLDDLFFDQTHMIEKLRAIHICAFDPDAVVETIYDSPLFVKQLNKTISPELLGHLSLESFKLLVVRYFDMFKMHDKGPLAKILELLVRYADIYNDDDEYAADEVAKIKQILAELNEIRISPELALQYYYIPLAMACVVLDMYFILRIHKVKPGGMVFNNKKLVVGYFGSSHVESLKKYFVDIVKTHEVEFEQDTEESDGIRRINITGDINLDQYAAILRSKSKSKSRSKEDAVKSRSNKSRSDSQTRRSKSKSKSK